MGKDENRIDELLNTELRQPAPDIDAIVRKTFGRIAVRKRSRIIISTVSAVISAAAVILLAVFLHPYGNSMIPGVPAKNLNTFDTPAGAIAKFAASGKKIRKKDLGMMAISYGYVYVAQVAMGASPAQYFNAIKEAEAYDGPSLIIAYAPCINHGLKAGMGLSQKEEKLAVECGYWHLYRYNPVLEEQGKNPFTLDSKEPDWSKFQDFLKGEVRFASLYKMFPDNAAELLQKTEEFAKIRLNTYKRLAGKE